MYTYLTNMIDLYIMTAELVNTSTGHPLKGCKNYQKHFSEIQ